MFVSPQIFQDCRHYLPFGGSHNGKICFFKVSKSMSGILYLKHKKNYGIQKSHLCCSDNISDDPMLIFVLIR